MGDLATGLLWKRTFCLPCPAGHISFYTNKYSVVKKKDPVALQWCCTDAQLSSSECKYTHKTKQLQNQEALGGPSAMENVDNRVSGFPCPSYSCRAGYAAVGLDLLLT